MSNENKDLNNYTSSYNIYNNNQNINIPYVSGPSTYNANMISSQGSYDFGFELSPSSSEFFNSSIGQENVLYNDYNKVVGGGCATIESETRVCASHSSSVADHRPGEDSGKGQMKREDGDGGEDDDQRSQKVVTTKKKEGKKKQKETRISFMTKTEVDHLEDGYRWRKYGQKAVKNSPYPRSYYRCTTQKCNVKKRVERSYQDPTVLITTYESQHNHPIPTNRRTAMFSGSGAASEYNSSSSYPTFSNHLIINTPRCTFSHDHDIFRAPYASVNVNPNYQQQQQEFSLESEYELLKEMFPSGFFKQES